MLLLESFPRFVARATIFHPPHLKTRTLEYNSSSTVLVLMPATQARPYGHCRASLGPRGQAFVDERPCMLRPPCGIVCAPRRTAPKLSLSSLRTSSRSTSALSWTLAVRRRATLVPSPRLGFLRCLYARDASLILCQLVPIENPQL